MRRAAVIAVLVLATLLPGCATAEQDSRPAGGEERSASLPEVEPFATGEVTLAGEDTEHVIGVYIADRDPLRRRGLMGWETLPENAGMLFVFDAERTGGFWMKDTLVPLTIAFADAEGQILEILDMSPCEADPCPTYDPGVAYRYALEVEQGTLDELGVEEGWRLVPPGGAVVRR